MTRKLLSLRNGAYTLRSEDDRSACAVGIQASWYRYVEDARTVIDVEYHYETTGPEGAKCHPFAEQGGRLCEDADGVIVAANSATEEMVRHLLMGDADLASASGLTQPADYRRQLQLGLALLWD